MKKKNKKNSFFTVSETVTAYQERFLRESLDKTNKSYVVLNISKDSKPWRMGVNFVTIVHSKNLKFSDKEWKMIWELSNRSKFIDRFYNTRKNHTWEYRFEATADELKIWLVEWSMSEHE